MMEKSCCCVVVLVWNLFTCALWEARYVRVGKGVLTLQGISKHAQPRATDDGHLGAVLRLRHQPIGRLLVFVMTAGRKMRRQEKICPNYYFRVTFVQPRQSESHYAVHRHQRHRMTKNEFWVKWKRRSEEEWNDITFRIFLPNSDCCPRSKKKKKKKMTWVYVEYSRNWNLIKNMKSDEDLLVEVYLFCTQSSD